jgi:hypothetical protein
MKHGARIRSWEEHWKAMEILDLFVGQSQYKFMVPVLFLG